VLGLEKTNKNNNLKSFLCAFIAAAMFYAVTLVFTPSALAETSSKANVPENISTTQPAAGSEADQQPVKEEVITKRAAPPTKAQQPNIAAETPVETIEKIANVTLNTVIEHSVKVELDGKPLPHGIVHRSDKDGLYFDPAPFFEALGSTTKYRHDVGLFTLMRSQDNAELTIRTKDGLVVANGKPVGKLPHFGQISEDRILLTANTVAFLTGTSAKYDKDSRTFDFRLDPRLKIATGFDIFVEDVPLQNLNPEPRSVGSVLILPLLPIAEALGHDVTVIDGGTSVRIKRAQDSAELSLNLDTGLVSLRERPFGLVKDVALIDRTNLLLPTNAIEALTGTHVTVATGSNRIDILLDDELRGGAVPDQRVDDLLKDTPFTPETLTFALSPDRVNSVNFAFHKGRYNGRVRYEVQDLPNEVAELEPSWLSLDFRHTSGVYGSVGDYSGDLREFDGLNLRRIRGVSVVKETQKGNRWALAAGVPEDGRRQITERQSRSSFSGAAAGVRFASKDGWEAGLALHHDSLNNDQRAVLSAISGSLGRNGTKRLQWSARGDLGTFSGAQRQRNVDARASVSGRYEFNDTFSVDLSTDYQGVEFQRNTLQRREQNRIEAELDGVDTSQIVENPAEDNQLEGQDTFGQRVGLNITPTLNSKIIGDPSLSLRYARTDNGVWAGQETGSVVETKSVSLGTSIAQTGVNIGGSVIDNRVSFKDDRDSLSTRQYSVLASKSFDWVDLRGQYLKSTRSDNAPDTEQLVVTANFNLDRNFNLPLPKGGRVSVSPSISAGQFNGSNRIRGGVVANLKSGEIFGKKNEVSASFGLLQSINNFNGGETNKFLTLSAARQINFGKNLSLGLAYRNNLQGNQRLGIELRGGYRFNAPRRYTKTQDGRGVLKGQAFLDKNYDGIRQPDEPGAGGVILRIQRSGIALRSDGQGYYTIQNIKEGLHSLAVDARTLPLGFGLSDDNDFKATIRDGHISTLDIPIIQRGQLRGFTFIDSNEDGNYTKGEKRVEGVRLSLVNRAQAIDTSAVSTSFGQFAFDDLRPDEYEIRTSDKGGPGYEGGTHLTVTLEADRSFDLKKIQIPLKPKAKIKTLSAETEDAGTDSNSLAPPPPPPPTQKFTTSATP
jgi:hypothetical protein